MAKDQSRMLGEGGKEGSLLTLFGEMAIAIHIWKTFIGNTQSYFFFLFLLPCFFRHCITSMFNLYCSHLFSVLVIISVYVYTRDIESTSLILQNNIL